MSPEAIKGELQALAAKYGRDRTALMPIVQEFQRAHHHVSDEAMQAVADLLGIHPVEVYGVVTFYSHLDSEPKGRHIVRLCRTLSCEMKGAKAEIARALEQELGIHFGQTTPCGLFSLGWANCIGMCDHAPALLIDDRVYTEVTPGSVREIIAECRGKGRGHEERRA